MQLHGRKILDHKKNGAIRGLDILDRESFVATGYVASDEISIPFISDESTGILIVSNQTGDIAWQKEIPFSQGAKVSYQKKMRPPSRSVAQSGRNLLKVNTRMLSLFSFHAMEKKYISICMEALIWNSVLTSMCITRWICSCWTQSKP